MSEQTYVSAYLADPSEWWWSTDLTTEDADTVLARALAIASAASLPGHAQALGQLGAGALENLMSAELLTQLSAKRPLPPSLRYALSLVRIERSSPLHPQLAVLLAE